MIRYRMESEIKYGHFSEYLGLLEDLNELLAERGLATGTLWVQTVGRANVVFQEFEYPDLATYDRESRAFYEDPECMKLVRRAAELVVQGSNRDELLEPAPHLA